MKPPAESRPSSFATSDWIVLALSAYAVIGGSVTLLGWFAGWPPLTDWLGTGISMFANTALSATAAGTALLLRLSGRRGMVGTSGAIGMLVALIGGATLFEHLSDINLGVDTLLVHHSWGSRAAAASGRMGPPASISFTLLGTALALMGGSRRVRRLVPALGIMVSAIAVLALIGYAFQADPLFALARLTGIALQTATIIFALGLAVIASTPDLEPARTLGQNSAAGLLARHTLPFVVVVPIALGWIFIQGRKAAWFDRGTGTAMLVLTLITLFSVLLWWCAAAVAAHERTSRDSEARFRSYFELGLIGMAITSPDKHLIEANGEMCTMLGYPKEELLRLSWATLIHPEDRPAEHKEFDRVLAGAIDGYVLDERLIRQDGQVILATISAKCVRRHDRSVEYFVALVQDITERKRAEETLERAVTDRTASLREAVAQMEEFSYTVSHDLRAPLRGMSVYAETLLQDFAALLPEEGSHYLRRIAANAIRLDKMIIDVLTFSRQARNEVRLERVAVDTLVRRIVEQYPGMQAPQAEIEIEALPDVLGHEPSLTQALSNLLNNAVKFVAPKVIPRVRVWSECRNGQVRVWVGDNGIGIDPRYHRRLFHMFDRIHPDSPYEGTGVGLAIVRKAVERMGGKVGMESDGASGSRFWIEIKSAQDAP